jgi:ABC-type bacteriocin/lantibiotic exporter with double-glycine peptidase domain
LAVEIGVFNFFTSILQHYNFAVMGERLTNRIREKILEKLMSFEIGWFAYTAGLVLSWRLSIVMINWTLT